MAKIPAAELNRRVEEIAEQLAAGFTDREIMYRLSLKPRTFYDYKAKVYKIFGDIAAKKIEGRLEWELKVLKDRYLRLFRKLEERASNQNTKLRDAANAAEVAALIATNILKLELEAFNARQTRRELKQGEQKALRYLA